MNECPSTQHLQAFFSAHSSEKTVLAKRLAAGLCRSVTTKFMFSVLQCEPHRSVAPIRLSQLFVDFVKFRRENPGLRDTHSISVDHTVSLSSAGIIACPWRRDSLDWMLRKFGETTFEWKEDANHQVIRIEPFDMYLTIGGNHSIACGMLFGKGHVRCEESVNYASVLERYDFNGRRFVSPSRQRLNPPLFPELGTLFQLGKAMITT